MAGREDIPVAQGSHEPLKVTILMCRFSFSNVDSVNLGFNWMWALFSATSN